MCLGNSMTLPLLVLQLQFRMSPGEILIRFMFRTLSPLFAPTDFPPNNVLVIHIETPFRRIILYRLNLPIALCLIHGCTMPGASNLITVIPLPPRPLVVRVVVGRVPVLGVTTVLRLSHVPNTFLVARNDPAVLPQLNRAAITL